MSHNSHSGFTKPQSRRSTSAGHCYNLLSCLSLIIRVNARALTKAEEMGSLNMVFGLLIQLISSFIQSVITLLALSVAVIFLVTFHMFVYGEWVPATWAVINSK